MGVSHANPCCANDLGTKHLDDNLAWFVHQGTLQNHQDMNQSLQYQNPQDMNQNLQFQNHQDMTLVHLFLNLQDMNQSLQCLRMMNTRKILDYIRE